MEGEQAGEDLTLPSKDFSQFNILLDVARHFAVRVSE